MHVYSRMSMVYITKPLNNHSSRRNLTFETPFWNFMARFMWFYLFVRRLLANHAFQRVQCNIGHVIDRNTFQEWLSAANPQWDHYLKSLAVPGTRLRTNPDGDVGCTDFEIARACGLIEFRLLLNILDCPT